MKRLIKFSVILFSIVCLTIKTGKDNTDLSQVRKEIISKTTIQYSIEKESITAFLFVSKGTSAVLNKNFFATSCHGDNSKKENYQILDDNEPQVCEMKKILEKYFENDLKNILK